MAPRSGTFKTCIMDNILVLSDFSDAAFHAACYAAGLTLQLHSKRLILYHAYEVVATVPGAASMVQQTSDSVHADSLKKLAALHRRLQKFLSNVTTVHYRAEGLSLDTSINDVAKAENADLIVMGITGRSALEQQLIGSTTIRVAPKSRYPVLIVPGGTAIEPVRQILFACDEKQTTQLGAATDLQKILDAFSVPLMIVNVDHKEARFGEKTPLDTVVLHELLAPYHPSFHYTDNEDTVAGIMEFALEHQASMIILIPKNQGFLEGLFHRSVTKKLAYHSSIPLLVLHENKPGETQGSATSQV
jgi:nucleotide-binding universal stress UspA family protein